uniref:DUF6598 domain-containing protein n=1 Tax=Arundo donax TaxID=35708 RepID=A0A0A9CM52_ARUDO
MAAEKRRSAAEEANGAGENGTSGEKGDTNGAAEERRNAAVGISGAEGEINGAAEKRRNASDEISGATEKRRYAKGQTIGFGSDPLSAAADTDGQGSNTVNLAEALRDLLQATAEEDAAGDEEASEAMGFRLTWTSLHPGAALEETTPIVPKSFTYGPVPYKAMSFDTVQVFSVSIKEIKPDELGFDWPLQVYGLVAARDNADSRRQNIIFSRDRNNCQMLTAEDSSLVLTGPSRAVVAHGHIIFEIDLKVKGSNESEDKVLSFLVMVHNANFGMTTYGKFYREIRSNKQSSTEVLFAQLEDTVEATIDVKIVEGSWSHFCPRFFAHTKSYPDVDFVLFDPCGGAMVQNDEGMIKLSRSVITVESNGELKLTAEAREHGSNTVTASDTTMFTQKRIGTTDGALNLGFCKMEVCVSWSLLAPYY